MVLVKVDTLNCPYIVGSERPVVFLDCTKRYWGVDE